MASASGHRCCRDKCPPYASTRCRADAARSTASLARACTTSRGKLLEIARRPWPVRRCAECGPTATIRDNNAPSWSIGRRRRSAECSDGTISRPQRSRFPREPRTKAALSQSAARIERRSWDTFLRGRTKEPIQHMLSQRILFRKHRMIKVVGLHLNRLSVLPRKPSRHP